MFATNQNKVQSLKQGNSGGQIRAANHPVRNFHEIHQQDDSEIANHEAKTGIEHDFARIPITTPVTIQPRLTVNQPNDIYEQEADAVADKVMGMPDVKNLNPFSANNPKINIQRKCAECEEEEKVQRMIIQKKCDKCEEEEKQKLQRKASG